MSIFGRSRKGLTKVLGGRTALGRIISDGCRDYLVGIEQENGTQILRDRRGRARRFPSLVDARQVLRRADVSDIQLIVRVAADEACAGPVPQGSGFAAVNLAKPTSGQG